MIKSQCTVLVCSCDAYEDLWQPFFKLLEKFWPQCPYEILLNTETKKFDYSGVLKVTTFVSCAAGKEKAWSKRLRQCLKTIDTPYTIFMLDDFFVSAPVDQSKIERCLQWMDNDENIVNFSFVPTLWKDIDDGKYPDFLRRSENALYKVNTQVGLWKTEELKKLLRNHESPWQFENWGSWRANRNEKKVFYAADKNSSRAFQYIFGGGIHGGKWAREILPIFKENNIIISNYEIRGWDVIPTVEYERLQEEPTLKPGKTDTAQPLWKRIWSVKKWKDFLGYLFVLCKNWRSVL
ncbi:MAG: hypothetical protein RSD27_01845 [Ruthenibacterium sp.]